MVAKTLVFDIETAPTLGWVWQLWDTNVIEVESEWYMLCFAYKWLDEKKTHVVKLTDFKKDYKANPENDKKVVEALWKLFDEADVIIAHNGDRFDIRSSNARFLVHGLTPPSPYKTVDTLKVARRHFKFNSNKLDDLGQYLKIGRKIRTGGKDLWMDCLRGDLKAWDRMGKYNIQDVVLLEKLYYKFLPWINNHPIFDIDSCPCGSKKLTKQGTRQKGASVYQRYRCTRCGKWLRGRLPEKGFDKPQFVNYT